MSSSESRYARLVADAKKSIQEVTTQELRAELAAGGPPPVLIDIREDAEVARGRIPGALHLSRGLLEGGIEELVPDAATPVVLYCAGGNRSALSADNLQRMGYGRVRSLIGGITAWKADGGEVRP